MPRHVPPLQQPAVDQRGPAAGVSAAGLWPDRGGGGQSRACRRQDASWPIVEDEDAIRESVVFALEREGHRGRRLRRRPAAPGSAFERGAARSRHPRHRPARHGRPRAVPPPALALGGAADRLPDLARGGVRSRARPRDRRRRLPVQAVLDARADGPRQGPAAPRGARPAEPGPAAGRRASPRQIAIGDADAAAIRCSTRIATRRRGATRPSA